MIAEYTLMNVDYCMESGFACGEPEIRTLYGPMEGNFHEWQKKIKAALDPGESSDPTLYSTEEEFDLSSLSPADQARARKLIASRKWKK